MLSTGRCIALEVRDHIMNSSIPIVRVFQAKWIYYENGASIISCGKETREQGGQARRIYQGGYRVIGNHFCLLTHNIPI